MSRIDLNSNRASLLQAHKEVSDPNSSTNWALYGYEGKTNVLKLVEKGDGGFEELVEEVSSGKIMYAFCKVKDPNTNLPKFVLVNWQGEGVQEIRKGSCANHFLDVSNFFVGAHLTVHARTEDDIDEDDILKKVAKSSGANYGFHKEKARPEDSAPTGPVGSVYKRTLPQAEIKMTERDKFWEQTQKEEKNRQESDNQRRMQEKSKLEKEAKEREAAEARERETKENERMKKIRDIKEAERRASQSDSTEQEQWEKSQSEALRDEEERRKRSDQLRRERAAEAKALVSQRGNNPKSAFEQRTSQFDQQDTDAAPVRGPPPARKLKHAFLNEGEQAPAARKQPIQLPTGAGDDSSSVPSKPWERKQEEEPAPTKSSVPSKPARSSIPREPSPPPREPSPPRREPSPPRREPSPPARREPSPPPSAPISQTTTGLPKTRNLLAEGMPKRQDNSDDEAEDDDWGEEESAPVPVAVTRTEQAPSYGEDELYDEAQSVPTEPNYPPEETYDDVTTAPSAGGDDKGICARALYDYQAAEENEISFDPDNIITNIEMIDEGWWIGYGPDGRQGMFPANYVEVINT